MVLLTFAVRVVKIYNVLVWQRQICPICAELNIRDNEILPMLINGAFGDFIDCAYAHRLLCFIWKRVGHITKCLPDINGISAHGFWIFVQQSFTDASHSTLLSAVDYA